MKLGVHIGYWGLGLSSEDQLNIVQEAERLGYDSVWAAEAYGSDTATVLGWLGGAGRTPKKFGWIHALSCPSETDLYVAELLNWRVQKLQLH